MRDDRTRSRRVRPPDRGTVEGRGDILAQERLDSWTVLLRVLPCPAVCERISGSDQPWLPCAMSVARGPVSVCRCRTRTAARRAVGTRTSSPCGRSSPPATVAGSTRAPRASAPARSRAPDLRASPEPGASTSGLFASANPGGHRPPGFFACCATSPGPTTPPPRRTPESRIGTAARDVPVPARRSPRAPRRSPPAGPCCRSPGGSAAPPTGRTGRSAARRPRASGRSPPSRGAPRRPTGRTAPPRPRAAARAGPSSRTCSASGRSWSTIAPARPRTTPPAPSQISDSTRSVCWR